MSQNIKSDRPRSSRRRFINFMDSVKTFFLPKKNAMKNSTKTQVLFMGKDALWFKVLKQALESQSEVYQTAINELNGEAARRQYDLIVVDTMDLPENKIRQTVGRLKKQQVQSSVVLASASPTWEPVRAALKAGAADYITKSYDPNCVAGFLMPYLQNARSAHEKD